MIFGLSETSIHGIKLQSIFINNFVYWHYVCWPVWHVEKPPVMLYQRWHNITGTHDILPTLAKHHGYPWCFAITCQYCDGKHHGFTLQFVVGLVVGLVVMLVIIYIQVLWWNDTLQLVVVLVVGLVVILVVIYININDYKHDYKNNYKNNCK